MHNIITLREIVAHGIRIRSVGVCGVVGNNFGAKTRSFATPAYFHQVGKKPLKYESFGQLLQRAADQYGDRTAVVACQENRRLTFEEATEQAETLAVKLHNFGLKRGQHLGVWAPNTIQWYVTFLAAALGGFPLVCLNPALQAPEMDYALRKAKVTALITMDKSGKQNFREILTTLLPAEERSTELISSKRFPDLQRVLIKAESAGESEGFLNYEHLMNAPTLAEDVTHLNVRVSDISPESVCNIQFTSGTTGHPKAAQLSNFSIVNEAHYFGRTVELHEGPKRFCLPVPLFHVFGLGLAISCIDYGTTLVLPSATFSGAAVLDAIEQEKCEVVVGTPTMFIDMLENQQKKPRSLSSLDLALIGGSACTPELYRQLKSVLQVKKTRIGYGQTESSSAIIAQDGSESEHEAPHTVGKVYEHCEAKIINERGETVGFGEPGELCVRSGFNMIGYLDDEAKTREALLPNGWLRTGDEFILEPNGVARIVGRKKDMIIRGGENIFPKEIEDFLETDERIIEAQVVGVPDKRMGEEVCVFLRLQSNVKTLTEADVHTFCKGKIAHFKIPRYVRVIEEFPKTASGKIQKFKLRQIFEEELN